MSTKTPYIDGHFLVVTNSNSNAEACILIDNICGTWYSEAHRSGILMCSGGATFPTKELPIDIAEAINEYKGKHGKQLRKPKSNERSNLLRAGKTKG